MLKLCSRKFYRINEQKHYDPVSNSNNEIPVVVLSGFNDAYLQRVFSAVRNCVLTTKGLTFSTLNKMSTRSVSYFR